MSSTELILVNTPPKYGEQWWTDNIQFMLCRIGFKYDSIKIITDSVLGGVYDKLRMFDECRDNKQYLYLDLDVLIRGNIDHLLRKEFTILEAWWRYPAHTPLNSSIMSWHGDHSHIYDRFMEDYDYNMVKYYRGIDEFIYKEIKHCTYEKVCDTIRWDPAGEQYPVTLYKDALEEFKQCKECLPYA